MKHLKIYESFENTLIIDLLSLCDYTGGMYNAVEKLKELAEKSSNYNLKRGNNNLSKNFYHYKIPSDCSTTDQIEDGIHLEAEAFSYEYLLMFPEKNITFTFYNVEIDDENLLTLSYQNKYNL